MATTSATNARWRTVDTGCASLAGSVLPALNDTAIASLAPGFPCSEEPPWESGDRDRCAITTSAFSNQPWQAACGRDCSFLTIWQLYCTHYNALPPRHATRHQANTRPEARRRVVGCMISLDLLARHAPRRYMHFIIGESLRYKYPVGCRCRCAPFSRTMSRLQHSVSLESLRELWSAVKRDVTTLKKLVYKNTHQHRRTRHFARQQQVGTQRELRDCTWY